MVAELKITRTFRTAGLSLSLLLVALLLVSTQAGAAKPKPPPNKVKQTAYPVWTLAMDWPRVAYASGKNGNSETIHVWNVVTGTTSAVKSTQHGFAMHHTTEIAIAGKRLAWLRTQQFGNTELNHWVYTAPLGGRPRLLEKVLGYADTGGLSCGANGPQLGGLVGSGSSMFVSAWTGYPPGSASSNERLDLITPTRLRTIASGPGTIVSGSADGSHVAVLPLPAPVYVNQEYCAKTPPTSVAVYSVTGALLKTIPLPPPDPSTLGYQVALSGKRLVVLKTGLHEPSGPAWVTLTVFDWTTGELLNTWPVAIPLYPGEVNLAVHGHLAAVEGPYRLHLVDLNSGKDVTIGPASRTGSPAAIGSRGLVYAVNPHNTGRLVFVPTARLLALVG